MTVMFSFTIFTTIPALAQTTDYSSSYTIFYIFIFGFYAVLIIGTIAVGLFIFRRLKKSTHPKRSGNYQTNYTSGINSAIDNIARNVGYTRAPAAPVNYPVNNEENKIEEKKNFTLNDKESNQLNTALKIDSNKRNIDKLVQKINSREGVVPFIGAGLSAAYGYSDWRGFLLNLGRKWGVYENVQKLLDQDEFEEASEVLIRTRTKEHFSDELVDNYSMKNVNYDDTEKATFYVPFISNSLVMTTNFDQLLERMYNHQNKTFDQVVRGPYLREIEKADESGKLALIKMHGDIANESSQRIITKADYDAHYKLEDGFPQYFASLMARKTLVFLGCSLTFDRTLSLIQSVAPNLVFEHFAFLQDPGNENLRISRTNELISKYRITPIWFLNSELDQNFSSLSVLLRYVINSAQNS